MSRSRSGHSLLLAAAVVLAGCGGLVTGDPSPEETVTPAPVPTADERYPPGVSENSVSVSTVAATHEERLSTTNYTFVSQRRVVGANGTMWVTNRTRRIANDAGTHTGRIDHREVDFPLGRFSEPIEYWGNESVYASRRILSERTEFYGWSRTDGMPDDLTSFPLIRRALSATRLSVVDQPDGVRLVGSSLRRPGALPKPPYLTDPRNVSLTVHVTDAGMVTRWRLAYDATLEGENQTVRVTREARISDVGTTTVERPDWVDAAREQTQEQFDD